MGECKIAFGIFLTNFTGYFHSRSGMHFDCEKSKVKFLHRKSEEKLVTSKKNLECIITFINSCFFLLVQVKSTHFRLNVSGHSVIFNLQVVL